MEILVVDDEPIALRKLERTIDEVLPNAVLHCFSRAGEAMEFAKKNSIDIAFLDIRMRVMDGVTMAKKLKEIYPHINIIFCTGFIEYAYDAHDIFCSAYLLKPVTAERVRAAVENLRFPIEEKTHSENEITITCFGNFSVSCGGKPVIFEYQRTNELLAYLVDRNGADCTTREIMAVLFGDEFKMPYFQRLRRDLINTFADLGAGEIILQSKGHLGIDRNAVSCDYFDYLDGKTTKKPEQYMNQYSFAEATFAAIKSKS